MADIPQPSDAKLYQGLEKHSAIANKWIGYVPLESVLGKDYSNLELRLTRFTMPPLEIGSSNVSFKGYSIQVPTHVLNSETKEVTFEYIVDEDFENYAALYNWASGIGNIVDIGDENNSGNTQGIITKSMIPVRVWLLDSYKKVRREFLFEGAWIKQFNDLQLDYSQAEEVHHSFTMTYYDFKVNRKPLTQKMNVASHSFGDFG